MPRNPSPPQERAEVRVNNRWIHWAAALATVFLCGCRAQPGATPERPNVLLVTIETIRADHVGAYGYHRNTTPNLDRLARQGVLFENPIAQAPFTLPSITSLLTGRTPPAHGVRNHPAQLAADIPTLAEQLQAAGYQTAAMTRHSWLRLKSGLDRGFEQYHNNKFSAGLDARSLSLSAIDWLKARDKRRPFFLWLHFLDPHLPYTPAYPYSALYHPEHQEDAQVMHLHSMIDRERENFEPTPYADLAGGPYYDLVLHHYPDNPILLDLALRRRSRGSIFFGQENYPQASVDQIVDLYDGALVYTDDNLGRLLRALDDMELQDSTLVAVAGDHGEALGDHDLFFTHDFTLYDELIRVPMALRYPKAISAGVVVSQQVRLMDLAPTILELAGLESLEGAEAVSLVPLAKGGSSPFLPAFAESAPFRRLFPEHDRVFYEGNRGKWRMVRKEGWKLIRIPHPKGDRYELYDLVNDPREQVNLFEKFPGEAAKLSPLLRDWMESDPDRDRDQSAEEEKALEELDPATRQQLETFGYIK